MRSLWSIWCFRFIRNLIRRWHIKRRLGDGAYCNFHDVNLLVCDHCDRAGILIENGRAYCYKHAGFMSAEHLRIAMRLKNAKAFAYDGVPVKSLPCSE